jgi:hypothetical protein
VYPLIVQPDGAETPFQFSVVLLLVVFDAARPLGAEGTLVQVLAEVVTLIDALCEPVPAESVAATVNVYDVDADRPVTLNVVPEVVPIDVPPL